MELTLSKPAHEELRHLADRACPKLLRTMREFAYEEIVLPNGPFEGQLLCPEFQPYVDLWFRAVDSGNWGRFFATGPTQSGKSLACFVIPILYFLFEMGETVVCGVPDMDMAGDKWRLDLKPVIEYGVFNDQLPVRGGGSRGGKVESVQFRNGVELKFMSGGGGDKSVAGFTTRIVAMTEIDGFDQASTTSRESDRVRQIEARTRSFSRHGQPLIFGECTVSIEEGRTWQEYNGGTASKIMKKCPKCGKWVCPEREHLVGWREARDELHAKEISHFACPECGKHLSEDDRGKMLAGAMLLHKGQTIRRNRVVGGLPKTQTLGFRWNAFDNLFTDAGIVGADEWRAANGVDDESGEKEMRQFVWALPVVSDLFDVTPLNSRKVMRRTCELTQGIVPDEAVFFTVGLDIAVKAGHWAAIAWLEDGTGWVVEYGILEMPPSDKKTWARAITAGLEDFRDTVILKGWNLHDGKDALVPDQVWVDSGFNPGDAIYQFCRKSAELAGEQGADRFRPTKGHGTTQKMSPYRAPTKKGKDIRFVGDEYHMTLLREKRTMLVHVNADYWKSWLQARLAAPLGSPGSLQLFKARQASQHHSFSKHMVSERMVEEFIPGKGTVRRWEVQHRNNHWLDATSLACAAAHFCGVRLIKGKEAVAVPDAPKEKKTGFRMPGGRPFVAAERRE